MGQMQSDLSSAKYGYDFVVATTQESINATMKEYLSGVAEPEVIMCYVMDTTGNPQVIDYKALVRLVNNPDPFSVPNGANPATDEGVQNLAGAYFKGALIAAEVGAHNQAITKYQQAEAIYQKLVAAYPESPGYQKELARTNNNLGNLQSQSDQREAALESYDKARNLQEKSVAAHPDIPDYQNELAATLVNASTLTVKVPAGRVVADYTIQLINGDGSATSSGIAFTVTS